MRTHDATNRLIAFEKLGYAPEHITGDNKGRQWFRDHNGWVTFSSEDAYRLLEDLEKHG